MKSFEIALPQPCGETYEQMHGTGCGRRCDACETIVHDLAAMTFAEAEALVSSDTQPCVRARIASDGVIQLADGSRRMNAIIAGSMALAVAACQTVNVTPLYTLSGRAAIGADVTLVGAGRSKHVRVGRSGAFQFANLPAGTYSLSSYDCDGGKVDMPGIQIADQDEEVGFFQDAGCEVIIVGLMVPAASANRQG